MSDTFGSPSDPVDQPTEAYPPPTHFGLTPDQWAAQGPQESQRAEDVLPTQSPWVLPPPPPQAAWGGPYSPQSYAPPQPQAGNGLATSGMVLGILAACFFWVPFLNLILAVLATALGGTGWAKANKTGVGKGQAITGTVLGVVVLAAGAIFMIVIFSAASAGTAVGA